MKLDKNTIIGDILDMDASCAEIFMEFDMDCMQCPSSRGETLEEACEIHDVILDKLIQRLGEYLRIQ